MSLGGLQLFHPGLAICVPCDRDWCSGNPEILLGLVGSALTGK